MAFKVTVQTNLSKFRANTRRRIRKIKEAELNSINKIAKFMQLQAKFNAPKQTGDLINAIKIKSIQNGKRIFVDVVPGDFQYPNWVNAEKGFETSNFKKGRLKGITARYGASPTDWNWSAEPKFWDRAIETTKQRAKSVIIQEYKRKIKVSV